MDKDLLKIFARIPSTEADARRITPLIRLDGDRLPLQFEDFEIHIWQIRYSPGIMSIVPFSGHSQIPDGMSLVPVGASFDYKTSRIKIEVGYRSTHGFDPFVRLCGFLGHELRHLRQFQIASRKRLKRISRDRWTGMAANHLDFLERYLLDPLEIDAFVQTVFIHSSLQGKSFEQSSNMVLNEFRRGARERCPVRELDELLNIVRHAWTSHAQLCLETTRVLLQ